MIFIQRQKDILEMLKREQYVRSKELAQRFDVSAETIRRDLEVLEQEGLVQRSHGGATYKASVSDIKVFRVRGGQNLFEKEAIARAAADFIQNGDVIVVLGSTTTVCLLPYLKTRKSLTLITNDMQLGLSVGEKEENTVFFLGGKYIAFEQCSWGDETDAMMARFHPDKVFFSATGISGSDGITAALPEERNLIQQAVRNGREIILLADHTKFSNTGLYSTVGLEKLSVVVTDWRTPQKLVNEMREKGCKVVIAKK